MGWQAQTNALGAAEMIPAHANPERSSGSTICVFGRCAFVIDHSAGRDLIELHHHKGAVTSTSRFSAALARRRCRSGNQAVESAQNVANFGVLESPHEEASGGVHM